MGRAERTTVHGAGSLENDIVAAIRRIVRSIDLHSRHLQDEYGLTGPQLATLQACERLGPVRSGALARAINLSQPTITGIVSRLEKRGLLSRQRDDRDRRTVDVVLTEQGARTLDRTPSLLQDRFRDELARLQDWEQMSVLSVLQRIASMMDAETLEAAPHLVIETEIAAPDEPNEDRDGRRSTDDTAR